MDPITMASVFTIIDKGLSLIPLLIQGGVDVANTIASLRKLSQAGASGTPITDDEIATIEATFDSDLAAFNAPLE